MLIAIMMMIIMTNMYLLINRIMTDFGLLPVSYIREIQGPVISFNISIASRISLT